MFAMILGYTAAGVRRRAVGLPGARHGDVRVGRPAVPDRRGQRDPFARTGNDAADRPGHHGGVRGLVGREPRPAAPPAGLLVGAGAADRDHAARPLDRDAVAGADHLGAGLAGGPAARRGRAPGRATATTAWRRSRRPNCGVGDVVVVRPGGSVPADGEIVDGSADIDESMVTGESRPVRRGVGDHGGRRHGRHRLRAARRGHRRRRRHRTGRHPAAGHRGAELLVAGAAPRRPGRGLAVLVRAGRRGHHRRRLEPARAARRGGGPHHHRAGDRLPARAGPGDPAGGVDRHRARRPRRRAGQGPAGAGEHAHRRRRAVRQDRHADQGRADRDRDRARPR